MLARLKFLKNNLSFFIDTLLGAFCLYMFFKSRGFFWTHYLCSKRFSFKTYFYLSRAWFSLDICLLTLYYSTQILNFFFKGYLLSKGKKTLELYAKFLDLREYLAVYLRLAMISNFLFMKAWVGPGKYSLIFVPDNLTHESFFFEILPSTSNYMFFIETKQINLFVRFFKIQKNLTLYFRCTSMEHPTFVFHFLEDFQPSLKKKKVFLKVLNVYYLNYIVFGLLFLGLVRSVWVFFENIIYKSTTRKMSYQVLMEVLKKR